MAEFKGVFALTSAPELLDKLRYDLARMERDPADSYAAFDFFVTAEHLPEWCGDEKKVRALITRTPEHAATVGVTNRIANGAKHFEISRSRRPSVQGAMLQGPAFDPEVFQADAFQTEPFLLVELSGDDARALGDTIPALILARKVLALWEDYLR